MKVAGQTSVPPRCQGWATHWPRSDARLTQCVSTMVRAMLLAACLAGASALVAHPIARPALVAHPMGRRPAYSAVRAVDIDMSARAVDWLETGKYPAATAVQFGLIAAFFKAVDAVCTVPAPLIPPLFAFLSLRSRLFSALPANRPPRGGFDVDGKKVATPAETIRPSWVRAEAFNRVHISLAEPGISG